LQGRDFVRHVRIKKGLTPEEIMEARHRRVTAGKPKVKAHELAMAHMVESVAQLCTI